MGFVKKYLKFKQIIVKCLRKVCQIKVKIRYIFCLIGGILYFGFQIFLTIESGAVAIYLNNQFFKYVI